MWMRWVPGMVGAALLALICLGPAAAQEVTPPPVSTILTLDQDRFFSGSAFGKSVLAREDAATRDLAAENKKIERELETEELNLTEQRKTMSAADFSKLAAAFDAKVEEIRTTQDNKSRAITKQRDEDRQKFFKAALPALGNLLSEKAAVAILDKGAIILSRSSIDVTDEAILLVDAALGDGSKVAP